MKDLGSCRKHTKEFNEILTGTSQQWTIAWISIWRPPLMSEEFIKMHVTGMNNTPGIRSGYFVPVESPTSCLHCWMCFFWLYARSSSPSQCSDGHALCCRGAFCALLRPLLSPRMVSGMSCQDSNPGPVRPSAGIYLRKKQTRWRKTRNIPSGNINIFTKERNTIRCWKEHATLAGREHLGSVAEQEGAKTPLLSSSP